MSTNTTNNTNSDVSYYLDNINFTSYGVYISASKGITASLGLKKPASMLWPDHHGEFIDLSRPRYEAREITLDCFLEANNKEDFLKLTSKFLESFDKEGTRRLKIIVGDSKPLVYEVYCPGAIEINKKWSSGKMVGTFSLKLIEPEPIKKVLSFTSKEQKDASTAKANHNKELSFTSKEQKDVSTTKANHNKVNITISTTAPVNIYWGDGSHNFDIYGDNKTISHSYNQAGTYEIIITGVIKDIKELTTNATILWNKL